MSTHAVTPIRGPKIQHDGLLTIATGSSRTAKQWKNQELLWSVLLQRLSNFTVTGETLAEYRAMPKSQQDETKDVGGFVGGELSHGRRKLTNVMRRHLITLDADHVKGDLWGALELLFDYAACVYSTHSHRPDRPRLRLVIPLSRPVSLEEYQAVARMVAKDLGIDQFDPTTFEAHRLMYWPSRPIDVEPVFKVQDAPWLNPDTVLARYPDWTDPSYWPEPAKATTARTRLAEKAEDPHEKSGVVGAFCRTYSIEEAIETFLEGVYEPAGEGRYTFTAGTTTGGLVVYDDGKFAYSHHGSDPISGRLVNAFDLVRLHKFGELDDEAAEGTPVVRLPSYTAMATLAAEDNRVKQRMGEERQAQAMQEFGGVTVSDIDEPVDTSWMSRLDMTKDGRIRSTRQNIVLILENDPRLKGRIALNEFTRRAALRGDLPWRKASTGINWSDRDDEALRHYLEYVYGVDGPGKVHDALGTVLTRNRFHPVREYLDGLEWDGVPRLDTVFIDYLGAVDTPYVRAVTRKSLTAAVARVMRPGCKFDYVLVLVGAQGIGKSLLLSKLGGEWFSDSLTTVLGKEAYESLQGKWLIELGELAATRKAEAEAIKHFISKQVDSYRVAYGRQITDFPRQCVFFGTTNTTQFLKDPTGNRRFWPVRCTRDREDTLPALIEMGPEEVGQIWAEAVQAYLSGERLYLSSETAKEALEAQEAHREESERAGAIREFLDLPLPENWDTLDIAARRTYIHGGEFGEEERRGKPRDRVCVMEIWMELYMGDAKSLTRVIANEIHDVLRTTPGWEPYEVGRGRLYFGRYYGHQKAYVRTGGKWH